jgi:hypothetical protein
LQSARLVAAVAESGSLVAAVHATPSMSKTRTFILISITLLCGVAMGAVAVIFASSRIERLNRLNEKLVMMAPSVAVHVEVETLQHLLRGDTNAAMAELELDLASQLRRLENSIEEQRHGVDQQIIRARDRARAYLKAHATGTGSASDNSNKN